MFLQNTNLINKKIAEFYKISNEGIPDNIMQNFETNGAYNTKKIVELLWPQQDVNVVFNDLHTYKYKDYLIRYKKLLPIFQQTQKLFETKTKTALNDLKIQWLGQNIQKYLEFRNKEVCYNETKCVEEILLLTSLLENGLANVYFTKTSGKQAPHLLRDLINTVEVQDVFGIEMILILKILMGSPNSINLRNIVWHGFPKPSEIPEYYADVLITIIHTMGSTISLKNFNLKERYQILKFVKHMELFDQQLKCYNFDFKNLEQQVSEIYTNIAKDYQPYGQQLFSYYQAKNYIEFIILILPQIELLLRLHYGQVNNFDITAKLEEYYITMDTIFEAKVQDTLEASEKSNELLDFEKSPFEGCFHLIYDIFISPNGCRLRDKVSHGEVYLEALNNSELGTLVLHIFLNLLWPETFKTLQNYESKLHLNCLANESLKENQEKLLIFKTTYLENSLDKTLTVNNSVTFKVLIFQRPKRESELILLIKKISKNITQTIQNYEESITIRSSLMAQRELHSKRRKTLEKLKATLPDILNILTIMWESIQKIYQLLQQNFVIILDDDETCRKSIRFLKHSLTISEHFVKYSHCDSNEWIKSLDLCRKFQDLLTKFYVFKQ